MPDSTGQFLVSRGIDDARFWRAASKRVHGGWDQVLAWLDLFLEEVRPGGALAGLRERDLARFGATLDRQFYPGIPRLFDELRKVAAEYRGVHVEFYIVSGGLRPLIMGSRIVRQNFRDVWASEIAMDDNGVLSGIKRAVTFTEKTRYLFEIHKGLTWAATTANPYLVNTLVEPAKRPVPFANMIYVGDGDTDIPCFSLVEANRGIAFGVVDRRRKNWRRKRIDLLAPHRVRSVHAPDYRPGHELGDILKLSVSAIAARIMAQRQAAYGGSPAPRSSLTQRTSRRRSKSP